MPDCRFLKEGIVDCSHCGDDGLFAGTSVLTENGWQDVSQINAGDLVMTFENHLQPVLKNSEKRNWLDPGDCPTSVCPFFIPPAVLGNDVELFLHGETMVVIVATFRDQLKCGPVLVHVNDLEGIRNITQVQPNRTTSLFELNFESRQIVNTNGGAPVVRRPRAGIGDLSDIFSKGHNKNYPPNTCVELSHSEANKILAGDWMTLAQFFSQN